MLHILKGFIFGILIRMILFSLMMLNLMSSYLVFKEFLHPLLHLILSLLLKLNHWSFSPHHPPPSPSLPSSSNMPSTSAPPSTSKDPPKWVCSLLKDSGILYSDAQTSTSCVLCNHDLVNIVLMSQLLDVYEPDFVEESLSLPQWREAMQVEL